MKNSFLILVRTNIQMLWGSMRYSKRRKKAIPLTGLALLGGGIIVFAMVVQAIAQTQVFILQGTPEYSLYFAVSQTMMLVLLLAVIRGGTSNTSTDANFLLALPVTRSTVLLSKSVSRYLFDLLPVAVFSLPFSIVYLVMVENATAAFLRSLLVMFLIPLVSVGLAYILSYLIHKLSAKLPRPELIRSFLMVLVTVLFMVFFIGMSGSMGMGTDLPAMIEKLPFIAWGAEFVAYGSIGSLGLFFLVSVLPFALGVALQSAIYGASQTAWRSKNKTLDFTAHSPFRSLLKKELRFYFSIPIYVTNTIFGPVLAVLAAGALVVAKNSVVELLMGESGFAGALDLLPIIVTTMMCFFPAITTISASSISLEGKNIRILRASPLDEKDVFLAKISTHLVLTLPFFAVCTAVVCAVLQFDLLTAVLITLTVSFMTLFTAAFGLYVNLLLPKLDWDNETIVVKQSAAMMVVMFSGMFFTCIPLILYFSLGGHLLLACGLSAALFLGLTALVWLLLMHSGRKRYREL